MDESSCVNIASYLPEMARCRPESLAIVFPAGRDCQGQVTYTHYTFKQLNEESDRIAKGLEQIGIRRAVRTVLMVKPSLEFFALTFALFKLGAIPVMVDPGMGIKNLKKCLTEAEPEAFIGIPKAHVARLFLGWARKTIKIKVTVGTRLFWGGKTLDQVREDGESLSPYEMTSTRSDEMAAILFTSGNTGIPKGAVYTHGIFSAQVELIRKTYQIEPGEIDLPTFPLFALFDPALGMTAVIPDMDASRPGHVDPRNIIEPIKHFGVTHMFGSPALIDRVGRYGVEHSIKLPSLRHIISAGAPMPAIVLERFTKMLAPDVQVFTPYGATEALPVSSIGSDEILKETSKETDNGAGICVGRPIEGMTVSVIKISDDPIASWDDDLLIPQGEIGEIVVKGPVVTERYYNRSESTRFAKIADPKGNSFYHRMGDLGYLDKEGRLWFCGRKSHRVELTQDVLYTIPCESIFNTHPQVRRTALVGVSMNGGRMPVLCVEMEKDAGAVKKEQLTQELLSLGAPYPKTSAIKTILFLKELPVDIRHNAKIFREKLSAWAARRLS